MLSEQITITTTPTSIYDLLVTARGSSDKIPKKCIGIKLRCLAAETATVTLSDPNSSTGAIVLAATTESLVNITFKQFNIELALLSCSTGTVNVHLVVEQTLV